MDLVNFKQIRGLELVSTEAYVLGTLTDLKYNRDTWKVKGIRIAPSGRFKKAFPDVSTRVLIGPSTKFVVGDVLLLNHDAPSLKAKMTADIEETDFVSMLIGKKVLTKDAALVGTLEAVHLNLDNWSVASISLKLDKSAHGPLGVKKLLFNKSVSGVQTSTIATVGETIRLKISMDELRKQIIIEE